MSLDQLSQADIQSRLAALPAKPPHNHFSDNFLQGPTKKAAVLIPLLTIEDEWHVLFIRRTVMENDRHSGQVAFPGGRSDPEDKDPQATALREAQEELGIKPQDVTLLGALNDFVVISNYQVTPVVGVIPWPYAFTLQPTEVSRAFSIPLAWLADPSNRMITQREIPNGQSIDVIYFDEYDGEKLWGASARFMLEFLSIIQ